MLILIGINIQKQNAKEKRLYYESTRENKKLHRHQWCFTGIAIPKMRDFQKYTGHNANWQAKKLRRRVRGYTCGA